MYLGQIVAMHALTGACGGSDARKVIQSMSATSGNSAAMTQALFDLAVRNGDIILIRCQCRK